MRRCLNSVFKGIALFFEGLLAFVCVYFVIAILGAVIPYGGINVDNGIVIYVKSNGVHTDVCLPVETDFFDWKSFIPTENFPLNTNFSHVSIGWGDKGFFLDTPGWDDLTFSTAFNAAFLPGPTTMHVQYLDERPVEGKRCRRTMISAGRYRKLIKFIRDSFDLDQDKVRLIPGRGYWSNDNFYEAKGSYHLFRTCNSWTNEALKIAGVRTGLFVLFSDGIMRHLKK